MVGWYYEHLRAVLEIVSPPAAKQGFAILPKRWLVERTFAWFGHYRRLSKDYESRTDRSEGMIYLASIHTTLKGLAA